MIDQLSPAEREAFKAAQATGRECCANCQNAVLSTGPSSSPYVPEDEAGVASVFCAANPPVAYPSGGMLLGVLPPVRPGSWCGRYEEFWGRRPSDRPRR